MKPRTGVIAVAHEQSWLAAGGGGGRRRRRRDVLGHLRPLGPVVARAAYSASHCLTLAGEARTEKSPSSRIRSAAWAIASTAVQVKPPPTLIRCAPAETISFSVRSGRASTLIGFE